MKRKTISDLLKKLEQIQTGKYLKITNLNDELSKSMIRGGYDSANFGCAGSLNFSCTNGFCSGSTNSFCSNSSCVQ